MCSIMCYAGKDVALEKILESFEKTKSRGPDDSRISETPSGYMLFHRLAIMGLTDDGMQPFHLDGDVVVCNGEIYGYSKFKTALKDKYEFKSDSDCEVILPLYKEYGISLFSMLDAEFAMVIYDSKSDSYIAARDPIGIRPLYYGYSDMDKIVFASEPKSLLGLVKEVFPFPPGHYFKDGEFIPYKELYKVDKFVDDDVETICTKIREKLTDAVIKRLDADVPVGFLLSGGLDSSLVCAIGAKFLGRSIKTFAVGMEKDAIDLKYAREAADFIKADHKEIIITKQDVLGVLDEVIYVLGTYDITTVRASIGMYLICKAIREKTDVRVLLTGEVSDEIFGYKYTDFAPSPEAFQQEAEKRVKELNMYDVLRADRCISSNGLEGRVPFGDIGFVEYVMSVDPAKKMNIYGKGKYLLRHAFEGDYLPREILYREKAAFSDAVGHSMVDYLKEYAEEVYTEDDFEKRRKLYSYHAEPFTKESLLYREIFEKYYKGMARTVKDFWMPNKSWEGCDVNDPSARVLSNYGDSGK